MSVETLGNLGDFVVALIAVYLLAQGQRERRDGRRQEAEQRARRVTLSVQEQLEPQGPSSYLVLGTLLHVRNDGDMPVHLQGLTLVHMDTWERLLEERRYQLAREAAPLSSNLLPPRASFDVAVPSTGGWVGSTSQGSDFAVLEFRDEGGLLWARRGDTGELKQKYPPLRWWQRLVQALARQPLLGSWLVRPLLGWLGRGVARSAQVRGPDREPWQLRMSRLLWGYWGAGEEDEWDAPQGAPALWRYDSVPKYPDPSGSGWSIDPERSVPSPPPPPNIYGPP